MTPTPPPGFPAGSSWGGCHPTQAPTPDQPELQRCSGDQAEQEEAATKSVGPSVIFKLLANSFHRFQFIVLIKFDLLREFFT